MATSNKNLRPTGPGALKPTEEHVVNFTICITKTQADKIKAKYRNLSEYVRAKYDEDIELGALK